MHYALKYTLLLLALLVLQIFLFDTVNLGPYVNVLLYVAFIVLLPVNIPSILVLLSGLALGVAMDVLTGTAGVHTISTVAVSYVRRFVLNIVVGKEYVEEGGIPSIRLMGGTKFARYATVIVLLHSVVFFTFEAMNWQYYYMILLKALLSGGLTLLFVWLVSLLFSSQTNR